MMSPKIQGERLDVVLQRLRDKDEPAPISSPEEFNVFVRPASSDRPAREQSMETLLIDFIMPLITDAGIFQGSRPVMLLEYLRDDILPQLNESEELTHLATKVINDEIARHDEVLSSRQSGIAA